MLFAVILVSAGFRRGPRHLRVKHFSNLASGYKGKSQFSFATPVTNWRVLFRPIFSFLMERPLSCWTKKIKIRELPVQSNSSAGLFDPLKWLRGDLDRFT